MNWSCLMSSCCKLTWVRFDGGQAISFTTCPLSTSLVDTKEWSVYCSSAPAAGRTNLRETSDRLRDPDSGFFSEIYFWILLRELTWPLGSGCLRSCFATHNRPLLHAQSRFPPLTASSCGVANITAHGFQQSTCWKYAGRRTSTRLQILQKKQPITGDNLSLSVPEDNFFF